MTRKRYFLPGWISNRAIGVSVVLLVVVLCNRKIASGVFFFFPLQPATREVGSPVERPCVAGGPSRQAAGAPWVTSTGPPHRRTEAVAKVVAADSTYRGGALAVDEQRVGGLAGQPAGQAGQDELGVHVHPVLQEDDVLGQVEVVVLGVGRLGLLDDERARYPVHLVYPCGRPRAAPKSVFRGYLRVSGGIFNFQIRRL